MSVRRFFFFLMFGILLSFQCEKVLTESHPNIARIARSKKHIGNPNSEANR